MGKLAFPPSNEMIFVLCNLMIDVVKVLVIVDWDVNDKQIQLLERIRRLKKTKVGYCFWFYRFSTLGHKIVLKIVIAIYLRFSTIHSLYRNS